MNAPDFARKLEECTPDVDAMVKPGVSAAVAKMTVESHVCVSRDGAKCSSSTSPIRVLLESFDVSSVEIGMVRFGELTEEDSRSCIGQVEADPLYVDNGGEVYSEEFGLLFDAAGMRIVEGR